MKRGWSAEHHEESLGGNGNVLYLTEALVVVVSQGTISVKMYEVYTLNEGSLFYVNYNSMKVIFKNPKA